MGAHYYMECSNKGICDRKSGECECFDGYEGSFCQRAACPNACSGHGTCETIAELAEDEFDNIYALWDKDMTMGCSCDPGYGGADCSSRMCKYGIDPLYIDDESTARVASTTCLEVVSALEALPNTVIPSGSVFCSDYIGQYDEILGSYAYEATVEGGFHMYSLTFTGNPGYLKPIEIDSTLDGVRPTTNTSTAVWSDGMSGEFTDYFATQCEHVYVTITPMDQKGANAVDTPGLTTSLVDSAAIDAGDPTMFDTLNVDGYPDSLTATESKLLKKCLGDSDGDSTNNVEVYDWDYGAIKYWSELQDTYLMSGTPHAIKLVKKSPADDYDGGKFALIWYNPKDDMFYVATKASDVASEYAVFTTDGVAERVYTDANGNSAYNATETDAVAWFKQFENTLYLSMDASCESGGSSVEPCLQKGDLIFIADANWGQERLQADATVRGSAGTKDFFGGGKVQSYHLGFADTADLYTITKIWKAEETVSTDYTPQIAAMEDKFRITVDKSS